MKEKFYLYNHEDNIISSDTIPSKGINYIEKTISTIGIPDIRNVSIKDKNGKLLYNNIENIPLTNNIAEKYLMGVNK